MRSCSSIWVVVLAGCASIAPAPGARAPASPGEAAAAAPSAAATTASHDAVEPQLVSIPNAQQPLPGVVTGGQPSDDNLREAQALGYKTVISLLSEQESAGEALRARELGLRFVSIPIASAADLTVENARKLGDAMNASDAKPLILHCAGGNRAGALLALEAFYVDHVTPEDALAIGVRAGLRSLQGAVQDRMRASTP